ncbi:MAG: peroxiredoxin [Methylorubrum populi]
MIKVGDRLPDSVFRRIDGDGIEKITTETFFGGRKAVLFAVPGAYTPTCTMNHLPGFVASFDAMRSKGVDVVAVTSVNDPFVMKAWAEATGAMDTLTFLADGTADFARAIGLELELSDIGLGLRSKRYAMIVEDMTVTYLAIEESPEMSDVSGAPALLAALG